jgi:hypothetical protein
MTTAEAPGDPAVFLEQRQPFSTCMIWRLQREYFREEGIEAWRRGRVPHYITSNPTVARSYAELVFGVFRDRARAGASDEPIYLLELGAGSGRLAFHFLKVLARLCEQAPFVPPRFCYVLSDVAPKNLAFWSTHPKFQPFLEAGQLDFAEFDAATSETLELRRSGRTIAAAGLAEPLIVIANYFFDGIPQDLFFFDRGTVSECLVSLAVTKDPADRSADEVLEDLAIHYDYRPLDGAPYPEAHLNELVERYRHELDQTHLLFPHIGLRCLDRLRGLSRAGMVLLSADKGEHRLEELGGRLPPQLVTHGSFSLTVNYHAIRAFCSQRQGLALAPKQPHAHLDQHCMLFVPEPERYRETLLAFERHIEELGPDRFFVIRGLILRQAPTMTLAEILACLRMSGHDADLFCKLLPRILELVPESTEAERLSLLQASSRIWDTYYPLGERNDLAFELGCLLSRLRFYREATAYFQLSIAIYGESTGALFNAALCLHLLGEIETPRSYLDSILAHDPKNEPARQLRLELDPPSG